MSLYCHYCHCHEARCRVTRRDVTRLSRLTTGPSVRCLAPVLHRSWEQVHTSAAPFCRHLLLPSSQQPRNNTTPLTNCLTQPLLLMRSVHSWTGSWPSDPSTPGSVMSCSMASPEWPMPPLQVVPLWPPHTKQRRAEAGPGTTSSTATTQHTTMPDTLKPRNILRHGPLGEITLSSTIIITISPDNYCVFESITGSCSLEKIQFVNSLGRGSPALPG